MTAVAIRQCQSCGAQMQRRADARYCSATCRKRGSRSQDGRQTQLDARRRTLSVTPMPRAMDIRIARNVTDKAARKLPPQRHGYRIVPDETWPGMYRIRRPDGALSDMVNLTRALDAFAAIGAEA